MAMTESSFPAGRSPLRAHLSRRQQPIISKATSARFHHLQQVASWASLLVPPLGAFLGSHLASTSEMLGCPPTASPNFTCQRCESVLHVGINCSFRLKSKKLKKRGAVTKGVSSPINSFIYSCQHCAFESVISGTSKAYVKTKLSERAAQHKLSEPYQSLNVCMTEKVTQQIKVLNNNVVPSSALSKESPGSTSKTPGSTSKRTKRKGWQSLKQLCSSPVDFSPAGSKLALSIKSASPFLPQSKKLDSATVGPTVSQADLKCLIPTSDIGGKFCIKTKSKSELSEGDAGSDRVVSCKFDVSNSSGVVAKRLWSDAQVTVPSSKKVGELICSETPLANTADSLQRSDASGIAMIVEDKGLKQKSNIHHTETDAAMLKQLSVLASVLKHSAQDTISTNEAQCNPSYPALRGVSANVAPTSSSQGLRTSEEQTFNSVSVNLVKDSGIPLMVKSSYEHLDDQEILSSSSDKEAISYNSSIIKAIRGQKRKLDDDNNGCNVSRKKEICEAEADEMRLCAWESEIKQTSCIKPSSILKNIITLTLACERKVKPRTKKKPLFRRFGRQWFTICKLSRRLSWRII